MKGFNKVTKLVRFDWFLKYMLRDKGNFEILEGFLSELLNDDIKIIEILESESNKKDKKDKFNRVDILVKTATDERIIVEIQNNTEYDYLQRILYGACKTIVENIKQGEPYSTLKKVISVSIVYFSIGQGEDYIYIGQTQFKGLHLHDSLLLTPEQQLEFQKLKPEDLFPSFFLIKAGDFEEKNILNTLDEWVYFFKTGDVKDNFSAKGLDKAKKKLEVAKMRVKQRREYDVWVESLHDEASYNQTVRIEINKAKTKGIEEGREKGIEEGREKGIEEGREKGIEEGREKGIEEGAEKREIEIIIRLHQKGKTTDEIADLTDISIEKVAKVIKNHLKNKKE